MRYVLDTNVFLAYLRNHPLWNIIELSTGIFERDNEIFIPAVVIGELKSLAIQNNWGEKRKQELEMFVHQFITIEALTIDLILAYAKIDAYSQGRLPTKQLNGSARNMGKNDLWIAATASVFDATLITTDNDFQHLHPHFLTVAHFKLK